jgi:hypothetical protein
MLRATLAGETVPLADLRDRDTWRQAFERDGTLAEDAIASACGRYTIVRRVSPEDGTQRFQTFRRHGPPEQARWEPPTWTRMHATADEARQACWKHAENEVRR